VKVIDNKVGNRNNRDIKDHTDSIITGEIFSYFLMTLVVAIFCTVKHFTKSKKNKLSDNEIARLISLEDSESKIVFGQPVSLYDTDATLLELIPKVGSATANRLIKNKFEISKARCHSYEATVYTLKHKVKLSTPQAKLLPKFIEPDGCSKIFFSLPPP
jgi:hypothetical protein